MQTKSVTTKDNVQIFYDHYSNGHNNLVVIAHGFFNSKSAVLLQDLAKELNGTYDIAALDFRGHGQSKGLFYWTSKEYLDLQAVLEDVRGKYAKVGLIGFSLGAATSLITAARTDGIASVIAISSPAEFGKIEYHLWQLDFENDIVYNLKEGRQGKGIRPGPFWLGKERPIDAVTKIKCPILFIHGEDDWIIKPWHSKVLYENAAGHKRLVLIKNGPHAEYLLRENKNRNETIHLIQEWLQETVSGGNS